MGFFVRIYCIVSGFWLLFWRILYGVYWINFGIYGRGMFCMYLVFCFVSNVFFLLDFVVVVIRFRVDLGFCRKFCFVIRLFFCVL